MTLTQCTPLAAEEPGVETVVRECKENLDHRIDPSVFAGADVPGSPEHVMAFYIKSIHLNFWQWFSGRPDIAAIVHLDGEQFECVLVDGKGAIVGLHQGRKSDGLFSDVYWITKIDVGGRKVFVQHLVDVSKGQDDVLGRSGLTVDEAKKQVFWIDLRDGKIIGPAEASYSIDKSSGQLTIETFHYDDDRPVQIDKDFYAPSGLRVRELQWFCYDSDPCEDPVGESRFTYDGQGNLIAMEYRKAERTGNYSYEFTVNDRGDWISHSASGVHSSHIAPMKVLERRHIVYR